MNHIRQRYKTILLILCLVGSLVATARAYSTYSEMTGSLDRTFATRKIIPATSTIRVDSDITRSIDKSVFFARGVSNGMSSDEFGDGDRYKVTAPPDFAYGFGACLTVSASVSLPETRAFDPQDETKPLYDFPYRQYLAKDDIYLLMRMKQVVSEEDCGPLSGYSWVQAYFIGLKARLTGIFLTQYEQPYAGLVAGVLVAGKGLLDRDSLELFKRTSLSHVVVLSGSNVSIILVCIRMLVDLLFVWKRRQSVVISWTKKGVTLLAVWCFVLLTGGGAPIYRAAVSAFCGLVLFTSKTSQVYVLTIVVLIMTVHNPFQTLYDPSFHLTCCATYGLILFSRPLDDRMRLSFLRIMPNWLHEIVSVTLATQVFVFPYIVYMTGTFSTVFLLSNVLVLPLIPVIMLLGFVTMIGVLCSGMVSLSILVSVSVYINDLILRAVFRMVGWLAAVPYGYLHIKKSACAVILVTYAILLAIVCSVRPRSGVAT